MLSLLSCRCKSVSYTTSAFPACTSVQLISVIDSLHGTSEIVETDLLTFSCLPGHVDVDVDVPCCYPEFHKIYFSTWHHICMPNFVAAILTMRALPIPL